MLKRSLLNRRTQIRLLCSSHHAPPWRGLVRGPQRTRQQQQKQQQQQPFSLSAHHAQSNDGQRFPAIGDTIYALSTAQGRAGIAVIRLSGPSCLQIYHALCPDTRPPRPRRATVRTLFHPSPGSPADVLDSEAIVLYFPGPRTVTGEDVLELHVHGGPATVKAVLSAIPQCRGAASAAAAVRYAEPGEFTKRAFVNGRLDLAQIESLSDTLAAETEQQRRAAVRGNSGALGRTYDGWRAELLQARGEMEALIDFSEDQHFDEPSSELLGNVARRVSGILDGIHHHDIGGQRSELLRRGIRIALVGPPNVGKSSLMNMIVGREASIVSGEAGTTRDVVEASLDIGGYLCSFADTAGFRTSGQGVGPVEEEGIRRARAKALESDLVVVLASVERASGEAAAGAAAGAGAGAAHIHSDRETFDLAAGAPGAILVVNKRDAVDPATFSALLSRFRQSVGTKHPHLAAGLVSMSCRDEAATRDGGLRGVVDALTTAFSAMTEMPPSLQGLLGVTARQRQLLDKCRAHLDDFMDEARPRDDGADADIVLAAEHLRYAAACLARITGRGEGGDVEDVLGVVFEKFCVGK